MANISVGGIGSGLDVNGLVQQLVDAEKQPATRRLDLREARLQAELSSFGTFKGALAKFKDTTIGLSNSLTFNSRSVTSSNSDIVSASASSIADEGSYSVEVQQLAQKQTVATAAGEFQDLTDTVGTGTLTLNFGSTDYTAADPDAVPPVAESYAFTADPDRQSVDITIDENNNTLQGVRDAINDADAGVTASIVNDGDGYRLLVTADDSGANNSVQIEVADDDGDNTDAAGLSRMAFNDSATNMLQTVEAQDALLSVNGLAVSSESNSVSGVIDGVTLKLKEAAIGSVQTISVSRDTGKAKSAIEGFVAAYNEFMQTVESVSGYDEEKQQGAVLIGDSTIRGVVSQLRRELSEPLPHQGATYRTLASVGITTNRDGTLSLDAERLDTALESNPAEVGALFAPHGFTSDPKVEYLGSSLATEPGTYDITVDQLGSPSGSPDVAGSIGGEEATGDGNVLTGQGAASGLALGINGSTTGDRGTVTFTEGVGSRLYDYLSGLLADDGIVAARNEGINDRLEQLAEDRQDLAARMAQVEDRYRKEFTALDTLLGRLQSTSSALEQQLASLPSFKAGEK